MVKVMSAREFNQDTAGAKRAASDGEPVFIEDRGRATHVLLTVSDYARLTGRLASIAELLGCPDAAEIDFDPPRIRDDWMRPSSR